MNKILIILLLTIIPVQAQANVTRFNDIKSETELKELSLRVEALEEVVRMQHEAIQALLTVITKIAEEVETNGDNRQR